MKVKLGKKGFTLIELLAVIVILAILVAVAIPAVTRYLNTARKGTFASNAQAAIGAVRNDAITNGITSDKTYTLSQVNDMLDKKLEKSPYGATYSATSYVSVSFDVDGKSSYSICLVDANGNGLYDSTAGSHAIAEPDATDNNVKNNLGTVTCTP